MICEVSTPQGATEEIAGRPDARPVAKQFAGQAFKIPENLNGQFC